MCFIARKLHSMRSHNTHDNVRTSLVLPQNFHNKYLCAGMATISLSMVSMKSSFGYVLQSLKPVMYIFTVPQIHTWYLLQVKRPKLTNSSWSTNKIRPAPVPSTIKCSMEFNLIIISQNCILLVEWNIPYTTVGGSMVLRLDIFHIVQIT